MDPLSVAASVAGLVSLAGQLAPALYSLGSAVKEADKDARAAATEVASMSVVLQGLQAYIVGRTRANSQRLRLITVEHITASLTACVFTYSELDAVLKALHIESGLRAWDRAVWFMKRDSVQNLVTRLQNHKMSFTCMLTILQCGSAGEAERSMDRLCDQVELLLKENKELSGRLRNLEHLSGGASSRRSVASIARIGLGQGKNHTSAQSTTSQSSHVQSIGSNESRVTSVTLPVEVTGTSHEPTRISAFEEQLRRSRVYRHSHANHSESSLVDDGRSTLALSICSSLTLGEVSNISVFALPVFAVELSNASAYNFARPSESAKIDIPGQSDLFSDDPTSKVGDRQKSLSAYLRVKFRSGQTRSANKRLHSTAKARTRVFGVPLRRSIRYANAAVLRRTDEGEIHIYGYIPILVGETGAFLKEQATEVENIFATGSSLRRLREMQLIFDAAGHRYGRGWKWTGYTVHDAANLLLRYLLQLPEPVIGSDHYQRFRSTLSDAISTGTLDSIATIQRFQKLVMQLPASSRDLLLYLLDLMAVFSEKAVDNKMTVPKLAAIFQPGILSHPEHCLSPSEQQLSQDVLRFLVEKEDHFVIGMVDTLGTAVEDWRFEDLTI